MKTYNEIAEELFEKRSEYMKKTAQRRKTAGIIAASFCVAAVLALALIAVLKKPAAEDPQKEAQGSAAPATVIPTDDPTEVPTALPTENPTDAPTEKPTEVPTADPTEFPTIDPRNTYASEHSAYVSAANMLLSGEYSGNDTFTMDNGGVFFNIEGDRLIAYEEAMWTDEESEWGMEFSKPIASYPAELGLRAKKSLMEFDPTLEENSIQLFGFIGDDYIIFTNQSYHDAQAHAIFRTDDGENWYEFGAAKGCRLRVTGGCIVNDKVGFICFFDRSLMMYDDYTPRQLTVYRTTDGGRTWTNIDLWIPEGYDGTPETGIIAPPTAALSPVFDGDHGVILVACTKYYTVDGNTDIRTENCWFESFDGGESWSFRPGASDI